MPHLHILNYLTKKVALPDKTGFNLYADPHKLYSTMQGGFNVPDKEQQQKRSATMTQEAFLPGGISAA